MRLSRLAKARRYIVITWRQLLALLLLIIFAAQCAWLARSAPFSTAEQDHIWAGRQQLERHAIPRAFSYTPFVNIAAALPMQVDRDRILRREPTPEHIRQEVRRLRWLLRAPFIFFGMMLGASIWYVARRLYGNAGGYVALLLYCFSPAFIVHAATIHEAVPSSWGIFGIVFTGIAIAHNLYAPWRKWRYRTVLLSLATAIAVASHPVAMEVIPAAIAFIFYLAPGRRGAALLVIVVWLFLSAFLVYAAYDFQPRAIDNGLDLSDWLRYTPAESRAALFSDTKALLQRFNPALQFMLLIAVFAYAVWKRTRYFGNTAPLLVGVGLLYFALITPGTLTASLWALPFIFVFIGGIWADMLETRRWKWAAVALAIFLVENAWFSWMILKTSLS